MPLGNSAHWILFLALGVAIEFIYELKIISTLQLVLLSIALIILGLIWYIKYTKREGINWSIRGKDLFEYEKKSGRPGYFSSISSTALLLAPTAILMGLFVAFLFPRHLITPKERFYLAMVFFGFAILLYFSGR